MQTEQYYGGDLVAVAAKEVASYANAMEEVEEPHRHHHRVINGADHGAEMWLEKRDEEEEAEENLLHVSDDASVFYADFPLPDFPCMSSSSSSSSTRAPVKAATSASSTSSASSSTSSAASWAVLKSDDAEDIENSARIFNCDDGGKSSNMFPHGLCEADARSGALSSTASMEIQPDQTAIECMDVAMDSFGYMDLIESNDFFDPASIFQSEDPLEPEDEFQHQEQKMALVQEHESSGLLPLRVVEQHQQVPKPAAATTVGAVQAGDSVANEMGEVLLEWLRENRDNISGEDLRKIKIKKATIEVAAKRLGGGREAMKQLLKLILEWIQTNYVNKKRMKESASATAATSQLSYQQCQESFSHQQIPTPCPNPNPSLHPNQNFSPEPPSNHPFSFPQPMWIAPPPLPPYVACPPPIMEVPVQVSGGFPPSACYASDQMFCNGGTDLNGNPFQSEFHMIETAQTWPVSQFSTAGMTYDFPETIHTQPMQAFGGYRSHHQYPSFQYFNGHGQRLMRLGSSATKEARKKRMARQRRFLSHHHRGNNNQQNNGNHQSSAVAEQHARLGNESCTFSEAHQANISNNHHGGSWVYWPTAMNSGPVAAAAVPSLIPADPVPVHPMDRPAMQPPSYNQRQMAPERRQGWKPENNLKFLLQKVLKQSDVGNLGRIVLPKKEAETHLPELEARDGISIAMEDIGTSKVWNMRYRFWPNNKSRMYLLENTGDFVRANRLEEGDFIVIYSDVKCGKYLIRGVKVRQPEGSKLETYSNKKTEKPQRSVHAGCSSQKR